MSWQKYSVVWIIIPGGSVSRQPLPYNTHKILPTNGAEAAFALSCLSGFLVLPVICTSSLPSNHITVLFPYHPSPQTRKHTHAYHTQLTCNYYITYKLPFPRSSASLPLWWCVVLLKSKQSSSTIHVLLVIFIQLITLHTRFFPLKVWRNIRRIDLVFKLESSRQPLLTQTFHICSSF